MDQKDSSQKAMVLTGAHRWVIAPVPNMAFEHQEDLRMIPGVALDGDGRVYAPWNALSVLWTWYQARGYPLRVTRSPRNVRMPRPWDPAIHAEGLREELVAAGLRPGLAGLGDGLPFTFAPFQLQAIWQCLELGSALLKEAAGAGKTSQALAVGLVWCLRRAEVRPPLLVVTPASVLCQYAAQVERLTVTKPYVLSAPCNAPVYGGERLGTMDQVAGYLRDRRRAELPPIVLVGWESLTLHLQDLLRYTWGAVVFDESQYGKANNRQAWARKNGRLVSRFRNNRSAAAYQLAQAVVHRLATTATPIFDRRGDLWGQWTLVDPYGMGKTQKRFAIRYMGGHEGKFGFVAEDRVWSKELAERLARISWQVPKAVSHAELPPTRLVVRYLAGADLDPEPKGFGRQITALGRAAKSGSLSAQARLSELLRAVAAARKRSAIVRDVGQWLQDDPKAKILVFTGRHRDCAELAAGIQVERFFDSDTLTVFRGVVATRWETGEAGEKIETAWALPSDEDRHQMQIDYMAHPGPCVLVGTMGAWGTGLDLQDTDYMAIAMLPDSPGHFIQVIGRPSRLGQKRACLITVYVGEGTADDDVATYFGDKSQDLVDLLGEVDLEGLPMALRGVANLGEAIERALDRCRAAWAKGNGGTEDGDPENNEGLEDGLSEDGLSKDGLSEDEFLEHLEAAAPWAKTP